MIYQLYKIITAIIGPLAVLPFTIKGRFGTQWKERLGILKKNITKKSLWFHCSSVGEVNSAINIIKAILALDSKQNITLSVSTPSGIKHAKEQLGKNITILAAPLDFWNSSKRFINRLNPQALIIVETELWPDMIFSAYAKKLKIILAAGRLSERSVKRYLKIKSFMTKILKCFNLLAVIGETEKKRFKKLGVSEKILKIAGNPKYDHLIKIAQNPQQTFNNPYFILVAGSTHPGEEELFLEIFSSLYSSYKNLRLLIAPRHINRSDDILNTTLKMQISANLICNPTLKLQDNIIESFASHKVLILNQIGALLECYALADLIFIGGSFLKGAGHNPLEAAALGKALFFGPHMSSFASEANNLLINNAAIMAKPCDLLKHIEHLILNESERISLGQAGQNYLKNKPLSAPLTARLILDALINEDNNR